MRRLRRRIGWSLLGIGLGLSALAYADPSWAFARVSTHGRIRMHTTTPLSPGAAPLLADVEKKLERIPLPRQRVVYDVFVCNDDWRWSVFSLDDTRSAALARAPFLGDAIVRGADFDTNRYRQATGHDAPQNRSLGYLLAHELTHVIVADHLGWRRARALPHWLREGYAEYVALGPRFDGSAVEDGTRYAQYARLVAYLLEREHWSLQALLENPPERSAVESRK